MPERAVGKKLEKKFLGTGSSRPLGSAPMGGCVIKCPSGVVVLTALLDAFSSGCSSRSHLLSLISAYQRQPHELNAR